jgi:hypothetical protein
MVLRRFQRYKDYSVWIAPLDQERCETWCFYKLKSDLHYKVSVITVGILHGQIEGL